MSTCVLHPTRQLKGRWLCSTIGLVDVVVVVVVVVIVVIVVVVGGGSCGGGCGGGCGGDDEGACECDDGVGLNCEMLMFMVMKDDTWQCYGYTLHSGEVLCSSHSWQDRN